MKKMEIIKTTEKSYPDERTRPSKSNFEMAVEFIHDNVIRFDLQEIDTEYTNKTKSLKVLRLVDTFTLTVNSQDILKLMTWLVGQEEHKRREEIHKDKAIQKFIDSGHIADKGDRYDIYPHTPITENVTSDKVIKENQDTIDKLIIKNPSKCILCGNYLSDRSKKRGTCYICNREYGDSTITPQSTLEINRD